MQKQTPKQPQIQQIQAQNSTNDKQEQLEESYVENQDLESIECMEAEAQGDITEQEIEPETLRGQSNILDGYTIDNNIDNKGPILKKNKSTDQECDIVYLQPNSVSTNNQTECDK